MLDYTFELSEIINKTSFQHHIGALRLKEDKHSPVSNRLQRILIQVRNVKILLVFLYSTRL